MTAALEGGEWSAARPGRSLPPGKTRYPLYRRLGGPQGRSGRAENLVPAGIRSPDRPASSSVAIPTELAVPLSPIQVVTMPKVKCGDRTRTGVYDVAWPLAFLLAATC